MDGSHHKYRLRESTVTVELVPLPSRSFCRGQEIHYLLLLFKLPEQQCQCVMFLFSCWIWSYGLIMNYYTGLPCKLQANIRLIFALGFALAKYIETFTTAVQPGEISCFSSDFSCNVKAHTETKKKTL